MFLVELKFTNLDEDDYSFISNADNRVQRFSPSAQMRVEERPRMQQHGRWPVTPYQDSILVQHDGMVVGTTPSAAAEEREAMMSVLMGDLTAVPEDSKLGTLTLKKANWTETASADVTLESWSADIGVETIRHLPYSFSWVIFQGYLVGDDTDTVYGL